MIKKARSFFGHQKGLICLAVIVGLSCFNSLAQVKKSSVENKPKLIVGIVIDQMRYDFLYRYWDKYSNDGFKRLLAEGASLENAHYNYIPTYTGPGHSSIYTGTTPSIHGIVGNEWWSRDKNKIIYCVADSTVKTVGSLTKAAGAMSPRNLLTTTIGDELRLSNNFYSRVYGVALKDRGAILPAGHSANGAFWFDGYSGNWVTSSYYTQQSPSWLKFFNNQNFAASFLQESWNTLLPIESYKESTADNVSWEGLFRTEMAPVFPHNLRAIFTTDTLLRYTLLNSTPFGNTLTRMMAQTLIDSEQLGTTAFTDMLTVSFSSTDYAGHKYGPNSVEVEDVYLRLDRDLGVFLNYLDTKFGKKNVLVFLTADHGVAHVPAFLSSHSIPAGVLSSAKLIDTLKLQCNRWWGAGSYILAFENQQIYLNRVLLSQNHIDLEVASNQIVQWLKNQKNIANAISASTGESALLKVPHAEELQNGFNEKRGGDVCVIFEPGYFEDLVKGTTHGTFYSYDTHVPLLFWGWQIAHQEIREPVSITDIAPTLASWLHIQEPSGCTGKVMNQIKTH